MLINIQLSENKTEKRAETENDYISCVNCASITHTIQLVNDCKECAKAANQT